MGITALTLKFLKLDLKNSVIYATSLIVEFFIVFNIFNLYFVDGVMPNVTEEKILMGGTFIFLTLVILLLGFGANEYFVKRRGKEVGIELISGLSLMGVSWSFTLQNIIFNCIGIIVGGSLAIVSTPIFLKCLYGITGTTGPKFVITRDGLFCTITVLLIQIVFISLSNAGLSHRMEICNLIKLSGNKYKPKKKNIRIVELILVFGVSIVLMAAPIYYLFFGVLTAENPTGAANLMSVLGGAGTIFFILKCLPDLIDYYLDKIKYKGRIKVIYLRNLKRTIESSFTIMLSFAISITIISSVLSNFNKSRGFTFITSVGIGMISLMILITWIYKIIVEANNRIKNFKQLRLLGYTKSELKKAIINEMNLYIIATLLLPCIQLIATSLLCAKGGVLGINSLLVLIIYVLIVILVGLIASIIYQNIILKSFKGSEK